MRFELKGESKEKNKGKGKNATISEKTSSNKKK